jgi:hypothetical protein
MGLFDEIGDFLGTNKSNDAIAAQTAGANQANETQKYIYDQTRADQEPWRKAGMGALTGMQDADYQRDFTANDFTADPGYQFRLAEGQKALMRAASSRGSLNSGGTMKSLSKFNQGVASEEYNNAYNRFNADRDRRFNRLSSLAGVGQTANSQIAASGQNYGNNVSANQIGLGNANAAALIGQGNSNAQMLNQAVGLGTLAFCDERLKTNIEEISKEDLAELRSTIKAYKFRYKDSKHGIGDFIGPMAQDLQKSKLGRTMVFADYDGHLQVDLHRAMMVFLASMAEA